MNWGEIGTQIILSVLGIVFSAVGVFITYAINKYIKNDKVKGFVNSLNEIIKDSVREVYQTYVEALKKDGAFNKECQEKALQLCLDKINEKLPSDLKKWLDSNIGDINTYLKSLIESAIYTLKNTK